MDRVVVTAVTCQTVNEIALLDLDSWTTALAWEPLSHGRARVEVAFRELKRHNVDRNGKI
jgi:hypothetical protein